MEIPMPWIKRIIRSPVLTQVLVAALHLAAQLLRHDRRKQEKK